MNNNEVTLKDAISIYQTAADYSQLTDDVAPSSLATISRKVCGAFSPLALVKTISHLRAHGAGGLVSPTQAALTGVRLAGIPLTLMTRTYNYLVGTCANTVTRAISSEIQSTEAYKSTQAKISKDVTDYVFNRSEEDSIIPKLKTACSTFKTKYSEAVRSIAPDYAVDDRTYGEYLLSDIEDLLKATQMLRIYLNNDEIIIAEIQKEANDLWIKPLEDYLAQKEEGEKYTCESNKMSVRVVKMLYGLLQKTCLKDTIEIIEMDKFVPTLSKLVNEKLPEQNAAIKASITKTMQKRVEGACRGVTNSVIGLPVKAIMHYGAYHLSYMLASAHDQICAEGAEERPEACDYMPEDMLQWRHYFYMALIATSVTQTYLAARKWTHSRANHEQTVDNNVHTMEKLLGDTQTLLSPLKECFWDPEFTRIYHEGRNKFLGEALPRIINEQIAQKIINAPVTEQITTESTEQALIVTQEQDK